MYFEKLNETAIAKQQEKNLDSDFLVVETYGDHLAVGLS